MTVVEYIQRSITDLNGAMIEDVKPLTVQQLAWKPMPNANSIGFIFWHFIRSQDGMIAGLAKRPSVWAAGKWWEKMGAEENATGVGVKQPEVDKLATIPLDLMVSYAGAVSEAAREFLSSLTDADLETVPDPTRPRRTVVVTLRSFVVAHGWWHAGEIKYLKGLQGMPFAY